MTLTEYLALKSPIPNLEVGSVVVTEKDKEVLSVMRWTRRTEIKMEFVGLNFLARYYVYSHSNIMYTERGKMSVFRFEE